MQDVQQAVRSKAVDKHGFDQFLKAAVVSFKSFNPGIDIQDDSNSSDNEDSRIRHKDHLNLVLTESVARQ
jgi:hypothetical protein